MNIFKKFISKKLRPMVFVKRYFVALRDSWMPARSSYSQNGEDRQAKILLEDYNLREGIYIEVGANQPTSISNTYLFYRKGLNGVLIEPDTSNCWLLNSFRKRDIVIKSLVGAKQDLLKFNYALASVLNSVNEIPASDLLKQEYLPQLTLDRIVQSISPKWIFFLSIDTEGNDLNVLRGALKSLTKTFLICVEFNDNTKDEIAAFLEEQHFEACYDNGLNRIFRNSNLFESFQLKCKKDRSL